MYPRGKKHGLFLYDSLIWIYFVVVTQKIRQVSTCRIFLFTPQAWYGITRKRVWYRPRRMASPKVHFLRLDSIPSCNGFHTMLCIDSIHAFGVIVTHGFKSIRKLPEISFSSPLHKNRQASVETCRFYFFTLHSSLFTQTSCRFLVSNK